MLLIGSVCGSICRTDGARSLPKTDNITRSGTPSPPPTTHMSELTGLSKYYRCILGVSSALLLFLFLFLFLFSSVLLAKCSRGYRQRRISFECRLLFVVIVTVYDAYRVPLSAAHILWSRPLTVMVGSIASRWIEVDLVRCLISNGTLGQAQIILMSLC